ncbi:MAG: BamA/TamA family outer membrane protein [SAR324 cluster bacterium]|nr:BamA/TamA family outer membrane protein [SAR324 cluster bacterium]
MGRSLCSRGIGRAAAAGLVVAIMLCSARLATAQIPERRKDQFPTTPGYLIVPLPYEFPGLGRGFFLLANIQNMFESNADLFAIRATGDVEGSVVLVDELYLIPQRLILNASYQDIDKAIIQIYQKRGMDTEKDEFNFVELNGIRTWEAGLTLTIWERRFELFALRSTGKFRVPRIRDSDGRIIVESDKPFEGENESTSIGILLDLTDDRNDPRRGLRLRLTRDESKIVDPNDPEQFTLNYDMLLYLPLGKISTWVFNFFRSDANVTREGNTDQTAIRAELGFNCGGDPACLRAEQEIVDLFVAQRKNGTATGLGGLNRLRSYPDNRFNGAHTAFFGTEIRWNLTEEFTPFDYFVWKDTRTGVQLAFFAETGTVAESEGQLWDRSRNSYGAAIRVVTGSGSVYRFEVATGDEGTQPILWFFYAWQ